MYRTLSWLAPHETNLPIVFKDYLEEVKGLPVGSERLYWDRKTLQEKDQLLEAANQCFRDRIFDACWSLIDRFSESATSD